MADKLSHLTLGDVSLALNNLFEKRLASLQKSHVGKAYELILKKRRDQLNSVPAELIGGRALSDRLEEADEKHDRYLDTMLHATEAAVQDPDTPEEIREAAREILETLKLRAKDKNEDYSTEASTAKKREEKIRELELQFKKFPLVGGRTLFDTAISYVESGKLLDELLEERSRLNQMSTTDRLIVRDLRPSIIGLINRCRAAMADEIADNQELPRNLDAEIFGYFDELQQGQTARNRSRAETRARAHAEEKARQAVEARRKAAEAQHEAEEKAREAQEAQRKAQEAKAEAEKKTKDSQESKS